MVSVEDANTLDASSNQGSQQKINVVACVECGCSSGLRWAGWRAYRIDDPEIQEPPTLAFYCPACAEREFRVN